MFVPITIKIAGSTCRTETDTKLHFRENAVIKYCSNRKKNKQTKKNTAYTVLCKSEDAPTPFPISNSLTLHFLRGLPHERTFDSINQTFK